MTRHINAAGRELVKAAEGCRLESYRCPAGIATVGFGHTGPDVRIPMTITEERAEELLDNDLRRFETGVEAMCGGYPTTDGQFSALVSFSFNLGLHALAGSTLLRKHKAKDYAGAAEQFLAWDKAAGRVLPGLTKRRVAERKLYLS